MKISIITVNYNNDFSLENTISSVIKQYFLDYEYIVIDGGSNDNSVEIIKKYASKITYWISEKDNGIYHAMNKGIAQASGEYILFLNAGDIFADTTVLQKIEPYLTADFVCGNALLKYQTKTVLWEAPSFINKMFFLQRQSVCHQSLFIKTSLLKQRKYDETLRIVADYEQFFFETVVNQRTYRKADITISIYGCDGISSNHKKSDAEKRSVLEKFRTSSYIEADELQELVNTLKIGTSKYKLALLFMRLIINRKL
jgi:putative colanic acid biosynthesis glycosyltransferase